MHQPTVVLNYSGFKHSQVMMFCGVWPVLTKKEYELYSPVSPFLSARYLGLEQADPALVFGLECPLRKRAVIIFMPPYCNQLREAPKRLIEEILKQASSLQTAVLYVKINNSLSAGRITIYNKAYL